MNFSFLKYYNRNLVLLFFSQAIFVAVIIISFTVSGLIGEMLATDPKNATLPTAFFSLATLSCIFPASILMKRIGRKKGFLLGIASGIISGIMSVIAIYMDSFALFCVANLFLGGYQAFAQYYRFAAVELSDNQYSVGTAVSVVLTAGVLGTLIGPTLSSIFNHWNPLYHYAEAYVVAGFLSLLSLVLCFFIQSPKHVSLVPSLKINHAFSSLRKDKKYLVALINACVGYFLMVLLMTGTPLSMHKHGFDLTHINFVIQWHLLGMYLPSFFMGKLLTRYGAKLGCIVAIVLFLLSFIFISHSNSFLIFSVALVLVGIAWNMMYMAGSMVVAEFDELHKPAAQAMNETSIFLTYTIAAYLAGVLVPSIGWTNMGFFCAPFLCISLLSFHYFKH